MAIGKDIEIGNTGIVASYWRIGKVVADFPYNGSPASVLVTVEGWASTDARQADKGPVPGSSRTYVLGVTSSDEAEGLSKPALYAAISALPEFTGAVEV